MCRKVGSKWFPSWSLINIYNRPSIKGKETSSTPMVMVMLNYFFKANSSLKFKYYESNYN